MAKKLDAAKIWQPKKRSNKGGGFSLDSLEGRRVNIVSEKLCGAYQYSQSTTDYYGLIHTAINMKLTYTLHLVPQMTLFRELVLHLNVTAVAISSM